MTENFHNNNSKSYYISHLKLFLAISENLSSFDILEDNSLLFPRIDVYNRNISFSNSTSVYLTLLQLGNTKLAMAYALLFRAASQHQYDVAHEILMELTDLFNSEKINIESKSKECGSIVSSEMLILLFHEVAHGLFATDDNIREKHVSMISDPEIKYAVDFTFKNFTFCDIPSKFLRFICRKLYPLNKSLKKKVYNLAIQESNKEEIACDFFSFVEWIKYTDKHTGLDEQQLAFLFLCFQGIYLTHTQFNMLELLMDDKEKIFYNNEKSLVVATRKMFIFMKLIGVIDHMKVDVRTEDVLKKVYSFFDIDNFHSNCLKTLKQYSSYIEKLKSAGVKYASKKQRSLYFEELLAFNSKVLSLPNIFPQE